MCDVGSCRICKVDSECPSGACADDGSCVPESDIVYIAPQGVDVGPCSRVSPCKRVPFAISRTTGSRTHIVMSAGTFSESQQIFVNSQTTPAPTLTIHGGTARISEATSSEIMFAISVPTKIRDLTLDYPRGRAISAVGSVWLDRVTVIAAIGIEVSGPVIARDVAIRASTGGIAIRLNTGGSLDLSGAVLSGGSRAISSSNSANTTYNLSNLLVFETTDVGVELAGSSGVMEFVTIANTGTSSTGPSGLNCGLNGSVRSSIIWTPNTSKPPLSGACALASVIAGPTGVVGAASTDPLFVDEANRDFHLLPTSPARDAVSTGPTRDFEGDARPRGLQYDIGADEAP